MVKLYKTKDWARATIQGIKPRNKDLIYMVEADNITKLITYLKAKDAKILKTSILDATVKAEFKGQVVDFTLCRDSTNESITLKKWLTLQAFTLETVAIDEEGTIIDLFGGRDDISDELITCVTEVSTCFTKKPLHLLRAIKYHILLGYDLDTSIKIALRLKTLLNGLANKVSPAEIEVELRECFHKKTLETLECLQQFSELRNAIFGGKHKLKLNFYATHNPRRDAS